MDLFFLPNVTDTSVWSCRGRGQCICIGHHSKSKAKRLLLNLENKKFLTECFLCKPYFLFIFCWSFLKQKSKQTKPGWLRNLRMEHASWDFVMQWRTSGAWCGFGRLSKGKVGLAEGRASCYCHWVVLFKGKFRKDYLFPSRKISPPVWSYHQN